MMGKHLGEWLLNNLHSTDEFSSNHNPSQYSAGNNTLESVEQHTSPLLLQTMERQWEDMDCLDKGYDLTSIHNAQDGVNNSPHNIPPDMIHHLQPNDMQTFTASGMSSVAMYRPMSSMDS